MGKIQKRRVRSNCWFFYTKTADGGLCNMCKKEVRSTGNTTNLLNHLKRKHTQQYNESLCGKFSDNLEEESHSDRDEVGEDRANETVDAARMIEENNHQPHSMEAFHADQAGTVIWLQSTHDGQANSFQPQIAIVQHSGTENAEGGLQSEGETILGTGEIVSHNSVATIEESHTNSEPKKSLTDSSLRKTPNQKMKPKFGRPQIISQPVMNTNHLKTHSQNAEPAIHNNDASREDTYDSFGRYVASLLRNMSSKKSACRLQKEIIWLVLQEQIRHEHS